MGKPTRQRQSKNSKRAEASTASASTAGSTVSETDDTAPSHVDRLLASQKLVALHRDLAEYLQNNKKGRKTSKEKTESERMVRTITGRELYKKVKATDEDQWNSHTGWVCDRMKPKELEGMTPDIYKEARSVWIKRHKEENRMALNDKRNGIQQEVSKHYKNAQGNAETAAVYPVKADTIKELIFRRGLEDGDPNVEQNRAQYDYFVDQIVPKFAGGDAWGPNNRYTTPMCTCMQNSVGGRPPMKAVSIGDLVFAWIWFDNYGPGLEWNNKKSKNLLDTLEDGKETKVVEGKIVYKEPKPKTKHSNSKGGRCKFGGWNSQGMKLYMKTCKDLQAEYNNKRSMAHILKADEECLQRLRAANKRQEVEDKRAARGKKRPLEEDDDESDWEDQLELFDD